MPSLHALIAFVRLGRPLFLAGGLILYALGAAVAACAGARLDWRLYLQGQLVVSLLQLMTHYANDYFDLEADGANRTPTRWSGGSRVLVAGVLRPAIALRAAVVLALAAGAAVAVLLLGGRAGSLSGPCFAAMFLLSWEYSAPPLRLHASGLGAPTVALVVTGLVPFAGFYLQAGSLAQVSLLWLALVPPFLLQMAMILAVDIPDAAGDAQAGKRTLAVRLGVRPTAWILALLTGAAFLVLPLLVHAGLPAAVAQAAACLLPLAAWQMWRLGRGDHADSERWGHLSFAAVALLMGTSVAELLAFLWLL